MHPRIFKVNAVSLGILNNFNEIYAENNLNAASNSLSTVLNQLSSGSKINSGTDDAAGLSLVNGLQANSQALTQSETNATEGVVLLNVADGALSQVTNLLNRAVTLATEASNGTLDSSQDTAANQEYQSILSEISNVGSTTTYNQEQVFNSITGIFTGDSSTSGSIIDELNIGALSSSDLGDTDGVLAYASGQSNQNNVFVNLSAATTNATVNDNLGSATTTIDVDYLAGGVTQTQTIKVGSGTSFSDTAQGLINAINDFGLGLSASFTTAEAAGSAAVGQAEGTNSVDQAAAETETGTEITGTVVAAGVDPATFSTSGILDAGGLSSGATLDAGSTVSIQVGNADAQTITIDGSNDTLATLASYINAGTGSTSGDADGYGVTATVITNADSTQSLALANASSADGALIITTSNPGVQGGGDEGGGGGGGGGGSDSMDFTAGSTGSGTAAGFNFVPSVVEEDEPQDSVVVGASTGSDTDSLAGSITISQGSGSSWTIDMDSLGGQPATLSGLAAYIDSQNSGYSATASNVDGYAQLVIVGPDLNGDASNGVSIDTSNLYDTADTTTATATLGTFANVNDELSGGSLPSVSTATPREPSILSAMKQFSRSLRRLTRMA